MESTFSRNLACLRQDKGLSQRKAAAGLGISQALLSHYENGVREPGLNFVIRACDFYGVSADFLLGRTMDRDGATIAPDELYDYSEEKDNVLRGSAAAALYKKLLVNSLGVVFDLLGKTGCRSAVKPAFDHIGTAVYTVFRHLYRSDKSLSEDFFSVPDRTFCAGVCGADMTYSELRLREALGEHVHDKGHLPPMDNESLEQGYPVLYRSLLQTLHDTNTRIQREVDAAEG
ncbi:MAG: helix-turn-helix transcriptional regulator [Oscillospiraceae bacterium]|nr:helix-turn-helix transcriptional regulator [Oscillospiraceae bacterium]